MRILEICPFSAGICGVWARVKQESLELSKKGHEVHIFSSDIEKGTNKKVDSFEELEGINIFRFKTTSSLISKNVKYWFEHKYLPIKSKARKKLEDFNPDVIITHLLHPHSANIERLIPYLKKKKPSLKIFIVTHAPFNVKRKFPLNIATKFWRKFSTLRMNKFTKVIAITKWEIPYLLNLGISKEKIKYVPNGIPEEFFSQKKSKEKNKILFLGRIAPVKNLELLFSVAKEFPNIDFSIVGASEKDYLKKLNLTKSSNVTIYPPIYNLKEKINLIDEHKIFVLPSKREAMPQSLIEAMSREKIVISSNTDGGKEIVQNNENGFLFKKGNKEDLRNKIQKVLDLKNYEILKIQKNAKNSVERFKWSNLIKDLEQIIK